MGHRRAEPDETAGRESAARPRLAAVALAAAMLLAPGLLPAGAEPRQGPTVAGERDPVKFLHVTGDGVAAGELGERLLAAGFDVVARDGERIVVRGSHRTAQRLAGRGVRVVGEEAAGSAASARWQPPYPKPRRLSDVDYETFHGGYRTTESFHRFTADLAGAYPGLVRRVRYGESWLRHRDPAAGHELEALCITADAAEGCRRRPDSRKPRFLLMAQIHARELTTSELAWRFAVELVDGYGTEAGVTTLLNGTEVWIVPQANPDGVDWVQEGLQRGDTTAGSRIWQRKNLNGAGAASLWPCDSGMLAQIGVDLNRNWDWEWGGAGTSSVPCELTYGGPRAASEPETAQLAGLFGQLFPDQRGTGADAAPPDARGVVVTLHTFSDLVLFPWGYDDAVQAPNDPGLRSLAFRLSHYNGYSTGQPGEVLYDSAGATDDWVYGTLGVAAFTFEVGPREGECSGFHPPYRCQQRFWERNGAALMYAARSAHRPYNSSLGPTVSGVALHRSGPGSASVRALADDNAYGLRGVDRPAAQPVTAAEIYVGEPPWRGGEPQPLEVRGRGPTVEVGGAVRLRGFDVLRSRQLVHIRARDAEGNWGPVTSAWLTATG